MHRLFGEVHQYCSEKKTQKELIARADIKVTASAQGAAAEKKRRSPRTEKQKESEGDVL